MSATRERFAFYHPRVVSREITAIRFNAEDVVEEVLQYDETDGRIKSVPLNHGYPAHFDTSRDKLGMASVAMGVTISQPRLRALSM